MTPTPVSQNGAVALEHGSSFGYRSFPEIVVCRRERRSAARGRLKICRVVRLRVIGAPKVRFAGIDLYPLEEDDLLEAEGVGCHWAVMNGVE